MKLNFGLPFLLFWLNMFQVFGNNVDNPGIQWVEGLTWQQVKQKAKNEGKYIFIDAFATWCGPCKKMDRETYIDTAVGALFNQRFLAVKVQMDKTDKDNDEVKRWYKDAVNMMKEYQIRAYPTLIFLSPDGEVVNKLSGFRSAKQFITQANIALKPGQKYIDPNDQYFVLLEEYKAGKKNYEAMPVLFKKALELKEPEIAWAVSKEYMKYLGNKKGNDLYTKANIEFLTAHSLTSHSPYYDMFYRNGKKVDKAMSKKGYAQSIVDQIILREIVAPFLNITIGGAGMVGGKRDTSEADWRTLYKMIKDRYNEKHAERNLLDARLLWYEQHYNTLKVRQYLIEGLGKFGVDSINELGPRSCRRVNSEFWQVYLSVTDTVMLQVAATYMKQVVEHSVSLPQHTMYMDTYACLLYKLGHIQEALSWEKKALQIAKEKGYTSYVNSFEKTLSKMERGIQNK